MNQADTDIQSALQDIAMIKRVLRESGTDASDHKLTGITLDANILLLTIACAGSAVFFLVELLTGGAMTETLISIRHSTALQRSGVALMGMVLAGLLVALYFVIWRAARNNGEEFNDYVSRNFRYVKNLSLISDLLMKFITLSLLLLAGKSEWVAPVLLCFTGDYLLQGRLFALPTRISVVIGLLCIAAGVAQFLSESASLLYPLLAFLLVAAMSILRLALRYRQQAGLGE